MNTVKKLLLALTILLLPAANAAPVAADAVAGGQWYRSFLNLEAAHKITRGEGVTVAIVDTGVAPHPDLNANLLPGATFHNGSSANIGNGQTDKGGHGTHMAGLIAGHGRILGVAPAAKILPVNVGTQEQGRSSTTIAAGIRWAADNGADVISISLSGSPHPLERQAVEYALSKDIVVVAGAGNTDGRQNVGYPAAYPDVIAVCGVDAQGGHAAISVTGPELVICAPSDGVSSTSLNNGYSMATGTSESGAFVAGAAALLRSAHPKDTREEITQRLTSTAKPAGAEGRDNIFGFGIIDIVAALSTKIQPSTAAQTETSTSAAADKNNLSLLLIPGIVSVALVIGVAVFFIIRRRRLAKNSDNSSIPPPVNPTF